MKKHFHLLAVLLIAAPSAAQPVALKSDAERLHELFDEYENFDEDRAMPGETDQREEGSSREYAFRRILPQDEAKRAGFWQRLLDRSESVDRAALPPSDQVSYDLFRFILADKVAQVEFESYLMPINSEGGFHTGFPFSMDRMPLNTVNEIEKYIHRLQYFRQYTNDHITLMRTGLQKGLTQPSVILKGLPAQIKTFIVEDPEASRFFQRLESMPESIPLEEQERLRREALQAIAESVIPAYRTFYDFVEQEYLPGARKSIGASSLPNGKAWYEQRIRFFTTLHLTPDEVFETGQAEVARIRGEMERIIEEAGFEGNFQAFLDFLRSDPQFYAKTPEELLQRAAWLAKRIDGKLPDLFGRLPRLPYTVAPVPDAIAPTYTGGRYVPGSLARKQAGTYWVNTFKLESRPLYVLPALTLHEAVPGHHLQMALSEEMEGVPRFRRRTYLSAYGEGWGLYAEFLGQEIGMYQSPFEHFGRLSYEMWRACRLVIDVGIHYKGWSRDQAVGFLAGNSALSIHEVNTEIDRYIGWPGQAVSYKTGELTIRRLRRKAEEALGEKFDKRAFHDLVLSNGAVLLSSLEDMVDRWIKEFTDP